MTPRRGADGRFLPKGMPAAPPPVPGRVLTASEFREELTVRVPARMRAHGARLYLDCVSQLHEAVVEGTPVDTGFLRASLLATVEGDADPTLLVAERDANVGKHGYSGQYTRAAAQVAERIALAAMQMKALTLGFLAHYAPHVEDWAHMIKNARTRWPQIVQTAVRNLEGAS